MKIKSDLFLNVMRKYPGEILLDAEDYERLKFYNVAKQERGYVTITIKGKQHYLHRVVTDFRWDKVDHKNEIKWDCRKENLRDATSSQNAHNSSLRTNNTSGYKGVCWCSIKRAWIATIKFKRKAMWIGQYATPELAHAAYCKKAVELHGEFANLG